MKTLLAFLLALASGTMSAGVAAAQGCPRSGTLGTSRTLSVDPAAYPRVGLKSFPQTLPLADKEVVLTFDDGPSRPITAQVLAALEHECVLATFFLVGRGSESHPGLVRRIAAAGHSIGHHSWSHSNLAHISYAAAVADIERGIAADQAALGLSTGAKPVTPFFRFPYFDSTPALLDLMQSRGIAVFGADLWASDWEPMTPHQQLALIEDRLHRSGRGIILFHDPRAQTAAMLPDFLRYLRTNNYRVVHLTPAVTPAHAGVAK